MRRLPAEWEPQSAVQMTFPHENTDWAGVLDEVLPCFVEIASAISRFQKILIVCHNKASVQQLMSAANQNNLLLVEAPSNDTWARDHGGISVVDDNHKPIVLDFVFNGWGLKFPANLDNLITGNLKKQGVIQTPVIHGGMAIEGGGLESDGLGTLLTTSECMLSLNRNPHMSRQDIEAAFIKMFGLKRVLWLDHGYLAGDDTDSHIDTLARFCSPDTIAYVQCPDETDEHYEALQKMETELKAFTQINGEPYKLVPLPWPDACYDDEGHRLPATYANFLFINGAVLVPLYDVPQDAEALAIFNTLFPAHEVIGINCRPLILQHGSLHCVTMNYLAGVIADSI